MTEKTMPDLDELENLTSDSPLTPYNWSQRKNVFVVTVGLLTLFNSVFGSTIPSGGIRYISSGLDVKSETQQVLLTSVYLIGYVMGPLAFGPMSEAYGRRPLIVGTFSLFTIFTLACAVAPNWPSLIVFRLMCGIWASCPIAVTGGLFADVYDSPAARGRMMALSMAVTTAGPQFAPSIAGFIATVGWRWIFWISLIIAGLTLIPVLFLPETYLLVISERNSSLEAKNRKSSTDGILPIITLPCLYLSYASAIFFMYFEAYPLIIRDLYGMSDGVAGLAFLPIAVGACIGVIIFLYYDAVLKFSHYNWSTVQEYQRLQLACLGDPLYVLALFWLGWSASTDVHWIVPMLAGIPFGMGFFPIFVALINYLVDTYHEYAASAMAAASCCRSIFGAVLPFAATPMFQKLGIAFCGGESLLGFLSLGMSLISFLFIDYGGRIRSRSKFVQRSEQSLPLETLPTNID